MKGLIFDLDGVIVFTDHLHYLAWKKIADQLGIYFDEEINNRLRGVSRMESLDIILERYQKALTKDEKEKLAEEKNEAYRTLLTTMTPQEVSDEVRNTLLTLKSKGYKLAIGSSSKNAKFILEKVELLNYFEAISDGTNISKSKPDPEVFIKAAQFIQLQPEDCLVVEDAVAGIDAGISGGFPTAAIGDAVKYDKATYKLNKFSDLLKIVIDTGL